MIEMDIRMSFGQPRVAGSKPEVTASLYIPGDGRQYANVSSSIRGVGKTFEIAVQACVQQLREVVEVLGGLPNGLLSERQATILEHGPRFLKLCGYAYETKAS